MRKIKGVTLVELLLVMFIIGVLIAGLSLGFRSFIRKGEDKSAQSVLAMILAGADAYRARFGNFPATGEITDGHELVTREYIRNPNPPETTSAERTPWTYYITASAKKDITIRAVHKTDSTRYFSLSETIADDGTVTMSSEPLISGKGWYKE